MKVNTSGEFENGQHARDCETKILQECILG